MKIREIYGISEEQLNEILLQSKKELDALWQEHCANIKDGEARLLKCHLIIERFLDDILTMCLPNPKKILENSTFYYKVLLFEAINITPDKSLYRKIKAINRIRNYSVHYLNKEIHDKETKKLARELGIESKMLGSGGMWKVLHSVLFCLNLIKSIEKTYPFLCNCQRNQSVFIKEKGFLFFAKSLVPVLQNMQKILQNSGKKSFPSI